MEVCQHCSTPLGFVCRLLGDGRFCCRAHRTLFREKYAQLALKTLLGRERPPCERADELLPLAQGGPSPPPPCRPAVAKSFSIFLEHAHPLKRIGGSWHGEHRPRRPRPGGRLPAEAGVAAAPETVAALREAEWLDGAAPAPEIPGRGADWRTCELKPAHRIADSSIDFGPDLGLAPPPPALVRREGRLASAGWTGGPAPADALRVAMTLARPKLAGDAGVVATPRSCCWGLQIPRLTFHTLRPRVWAGSHSGLAGGLPG